MYHYTDSGLDNVYLINGYSEHETPYGRAVSIENLDGLHEAIAGGLLKATKPLNGAELRFLRHELDLSQKRLAQFLGMSEQSVARWEKKRSHPIEPMADRIVRLIYAECKQGASEVLDLVKHLAEADHNEAAKIKVEKLDHAWRLKECKVA